MKLKVCGLREDENVKAIAALRPQWMGFIFSPASPRYFLAANKKASLGELEPAIKRVGIFVNEGLEEILRLNKLYKFDYVQLHGNEGVDFCRQLQQHGIAIIKAFRIDNNFDFSKVNGFAPYVELFLFDTAGKRYGGNGVQFNWELLNDKRFSKPFLLSGGIGPEDAKHVKLFRHPDMIGVDVNSRFEISPGLKNVEALKLFQQQIV